MIPTPFFEPSRLSTPPSPHPSIYHVLPCSVAVENDTAKVYNAASSKSRGVEYRIALKVERRGCFGDRQ